jgi:deoxycytidine triphosphate deaminase
MILSGLKIADEVKAGRIYISDFDEKRLNPNSYNLRLADEMLAYNCEKLDMKKDNPYYTFTIPQDGADAHGLLCPDAGGPILCRAAGYLHPCNGGIR